MDSKYTILGKDRMAYIQEANGYRRRVQFSARLSASAGRRSVAAPRRVAPRRRRRRRRPHRHHRDRRRAAAARTAAAPRQRARRRAPRARCRGRPAGARARASIRRIRRVVVESDRRRGDLDVVHATVPADDGGNRERDGDARAVRAGVARTRRVFRGRARGARSRRETRDDER